MLDQLHIGIVKWFGWMSRLILNLKVILKDTNSTSICPILSVFVFLMT